MRGAIPMAPLQKGVRQRERVRYRLEEDTIADAYARPVQIVSA